MRRVLPLAFLALAIGSSWTLSVLNAADDAEPKFTIKEVMDKAHKKGLAKKVAGGGATKEEKDELVVLYVEMGKNKPPKGDADSWKALNDTLIAAAKDAAAGKDGAGDALGKAMNCGACHSKHK